MVSKLRNHFTYSSTSTSSSWGNAIRETAKNRFYYFFITLIIFFGVVVNILSKNFGSGFTFSLDLYSTATHLALLVFLYMFLMFRLFFILVVIRPSHPVKNFIDELKTTWFTPHRIVSGLSVMIFMPIFFSFFTSAKNLIPFMNPFSWDPVLAELDRMIHFGKHPWEWLHPILKTEFFTTSISFSYRLWFFVKYIVITWLAFSLKFHKLRERFLLTMLLTWIINGFVIATAFSSAGPCFFSFFYPGHANPYLELMDFLRDSNEKNPVYDLWAMDYLIQSYNTKATNLFSGISAFPSMHVSVAFLNSLVVSKINRCLGILFVIYFFLVLIGSVHLAWHYAIDGYAAILTTLLLWWLVGLLLPHKVEN